MGSSPKRPAKTAEEKALEVRQRSLLDKEIEENEERFKMLARGKLGRASLLSGAAVTPATAASAGTRGGSGGAGSLIGASGGSATSGATSRTASSSRPSRVVR